MPDNKPLDTSRILMAQKSQLILEVKVSVDNLLREFVELKKAIKANSDRIDKIRSK